MTSSAAASTAIVAVAASTTTTTTTTTADIFRFYIGSADKLPGQGDNERVADAALYQRLRQIPHWRRMFSSLWDDVSHAFRYDKHTFRSAEHAL